MKECHKYLQQYIEEYVFVHWRKYICAFEE